MAQSHPPAAEWSGFRSGLTYGRRCQIRIEKDFILLKKVPVTDDPIASFLQAFYCIERRKMPAFLSALVENSPQDIAKQTLQKYLDLKELSQTALGLVTYPKTEDEEPRFLGIQQVYNYIPNLAYATVTERADMCFQGSTGGFVEPISNGSSNSTPSCPYTVLPLLNSFSLAYYMEKLELQGGMIPAGFIWHIIASLLHTVIRLRAGYPHHNHLPVIHKNIVATTVMILPTRESLLHPYPTVKLGYFDHSQMGSQGFQAFSQDGIRSEIVHDLWCIGQLLHYLAHVKPRNESYNFTKDDTVYQKVWQDLNSFQAMDRTQLQLEQLYLLARGQRDIAVSWMPPGKRVFDSNQWELHRSIKDNDILDAIATDLTSRQNVSSSSMVGV